MPVFLAITLGGGLLIGSRNTPGAWYEGLQKPVFNPPNWLFAPTWTLLYILIAIAGALVWRRHDRKALALWALQMVLNFAWSPLFFTAHAIGAAALVSTAMLATIILFIAQAWRTTHLAAWLFIPYAAWVAYATILNASIWWLNR